MSGHHILRTNVTGTSVWHERATICLIFVCKCTHVKTHNLDDCIEQCFAAHFVRCRLQYCSALIHLTSWLRNDSGQTMINNAFGIILLFSQQCASGHCLAETSILVAISVTLQMEACFFCRISWYIRLFTFPSMTLCLPVLPDEKNLLSPCLMAGIVFFGSYAVPFFLQTCGEIVSTKELQFISSDHNTLSQKWAGFSRCSRANFRRAIIRAWSSGEGTSARRARIYYYSMKFPTNCMLANVGGSCLQIPLKFCSRCKWLLHHFSSNQLLCA